MVPRRPLDGKWVENDIINLLNCIACAWSSRRIGTMLSWCRFSCCLLHWNGSHRVCTFLFHSFYDMSIVNSLTHSHKLSQSLNGKADLFRPPKHVLRLKDKTKRIKNCTQGQRITVFVGSLMFQCSGRRLQGCVCVFMCFQGLFRTLHSMRQFNLSKQSEHVFCLATFDLPPVCDSVKLQAFANPIHSSACQNIPVAWWTVQESQRICSATAKAAHASGWSVTAYSKLQIIWLDYPLYWIVLTNSFRSGSLCAFLIKTSGYHGHLRFRVDPLVPNDQTRLGATKGKERETARERNMLERQKTCWKPGWIRLRASVNQVVMKPLGESLAEGDDVPGPQMFVVCNMCNMSICFLFAKCVDHRSPASWLNMTSKGHGTGSASSVSTR